MKVSLPRLAIAALIVWLCVIYLLFGAFALNSGEPKVRAMFGMVSGLIIFWVVIGGIAMYSLRDKARTIIARVPGDWRLKFIVFATLLALLEEAVTVSMTNMAPVFGVPVGAAYITASANYFDVVLFHSVIVFVPMFIVWSFLLSRYDFSPVSVFLLFGLTGTLAETGTFGLQNIVLFGMWAFVYGLMVYLPAYTLQAGRNVKQPKVRHYVLAVVLPFLLAIPVAIVVSTIHPVSIHFPPM